MLEEIQFDYKVTKINIFKDEQFNPDFKKISPFSKDLKKEIRKYLDIFKDHPYIFNLGHGVLPNTDPNMMDYLVKTVKDY